MTEKNTAVLSRRTVAILRREFAPGGLGYGLRQQFLKATVTARALPQTDCAQLHAAIATALRGVGYEGYVSVEMMQGPAGTSWRERLESALAVVNAAYGGARGACAA